MNSLSIDQVLFLYFNGNHSPFFDQVMALVSNMLSFIPVYLLVFVAFLRILKYVNYSHITIVAVLIVSFAGFEILVCHEWLPTVFSHAINRVKPCYDSQICNSVRMIGDDCSEKYGFFAYRAAIATALSTFLSLLFNEGKTKWFRLVLILWALLVCYSRVYLGAHYPFNVLISAICGVLVGYLSYRFYDYVKNSVLVI
jgi:undecaprenyl-diphosphatase